MLPMPLLLGLLYKVHFIIIIVLSILYVSLANGIKAVALSVVAIKLRTQINAGVLGTLNNALASVAAALTPTIIGAVIENAGWGVSYFVTFGISAVICLSILAILILIKATNKSKKGEI
jgi:MFS family permease